VAPPPDLLEGMADALAHRGPDGRGYLRDGPIGLGHDRLSIIDVVGGAQPLSNEDGTVWITFNGEIYNFRELRAGLEARGHRFATRSDTEVIVHLYEELGEGCFARLNGIFALAIWDRRIERLSLVRDPFGVKPLYYAERNGRISFASELKALLLDPDLRPRVDPTALDWFLTYRFVPSPRTILEGVRKVPPGHLVKVDRHGAVLERFGRAGLEPPLPVSEADAVELLRDAFDRAVKRQMVSDAPIGALLSGGVDSSAIVAAMASHAPRVRTYTVGFAEGGEFNELAEARAMARRFSTDHHELVVSARDYVEVLPRVIRQLDEPVGTSSAIPLYLIAREAKADVKVALAGQGADEPFAGYRRYLGERYRGLWSAFPSPGQALARRVVERLPRAEVLKRATRALATADDAERFRQVYAVFPDALKGRLLRPDLQAGVRESSDVPLRRLLDGLSGADTLARMLYVDARLSLADDLLAYGDRMAMAHGVELRVPFLDLEFMRLVERLPSRLKLKGTVGKYAWKRAAERWLPPGVIHRPKRGFATPIDRWFRGALNPFIRDTLLGHNAATSRYFDRGVVRRLIEEHQAGRDDHQRRLFALLSFEIWHRQFLGAA
jgi:asparagine synthase (glutamine-hydrolysing)